MFMVRSGQTFFALLRIGDAVNSDVGVKLIHLDFVSELSLLPGVGVIDHLYFFQAVRNHMWVFV